MNVQPIQLTADQITRIQTAGRIIELDRQHQQRVANMAILWSDGVADDKALDLVAVDYAGFKERNPRLPI